MPAGSQLDLHVHGAAHAPGVAFGDGSRPRVAGQKGEYAAAARISHDVHLRVRSAGHVIGDWHGSPHH